MDIQRPRPSRAKRSSAASRLPSPACSSSASSRSSSRASSPPHRPSSAPPSGWIPSNAGRCCGRCAAWARWCRSTKPAARCRQPRRAASSASCLRPGADVEPDTVVLELSDPQVQQTMSRRRAAVARRRGRLQQPRSPARDRSSDAARRGRHHRRRSSMRRKAQFEVDDKLAQGRTRSRPCSARSRRCATSRWRSATRSRWSASKCPRPTSRRNCSRSRRESTSSARSTTSASSSSISCACAPACQACSSRFPSASASRWRRAPTSRVSPTRPV